MFSERMLSICAFLSHFCWFTQNLSMKMYSYQVNCVFNEFLVLELYEKVVSFISLIHLVQKLWLLAVSADTPTGIQDGRHKNPMGHFFAVLTTFFDQQTP